MKKQRLLAGLSALSVALLAAGCSSTGAGSDDESSGSDGPYIAMVAKGFSQSYWVSVNQGASDAAAALGATVSFTGPDTDSQVDKQATLLQNAIDKSPDAVAVAPLDEAALIPVLQNAADADIPVLAFDTGFTETDIPAATIATDNYAAGQEAAKHFVELTGGTGKFAVVAHSETDATSTDRRDGFLDYIEENAPGLTLAGSVQYSNADQAIAENLATTVLQANPDLVGIFATNEASVTGAATAVEAAQQEGRDVVLVGFDSGKAQQEYVRSGVIAGSVSQNPYQIGYKTIETAVALLAGQTVDTAVDSGFLWYDASNIDEDEIQQALYE
ncbi:MAG TPA: ABC transporter substrate-binding protein [Cellulomonas sp.]